MGQYRQGTVRSPSGRGFSETPPLLLVPCRVWQRLNYIDLSAHRAPGRVGIEYVSRSSQMRKATDQKPITMDEIRTLAAARFGDMVKAVVDLKRVVMVLDADLHADQEAELLSEGSDQRDLWGINLYPDLSGDDWLEFDSMINLRPSFGNRSRGVDDPATRAAINALVTRLVRR